MNQLLLLLLWGTMTVGPPSAAAGQVSFAGTVDDILDSALVVDAPFDDPYGEYDDELTRNFGNYESSLN